MILLKKKHLTNGLISGFIFLIIVGFLYKELRKFPINGWRRKTKLPGIAINCGDKKILESDNKTAQAKYYRYIYKNTPADALFLSFDSSRFAYYSSRKYIFDYNPRMIPFYKIKDVMEGYRYLLNLGINYIFLPYHLTPTFSRSTIHKILADPKVSKLEFMSGTNRIFKLLPARQEIITGSTFCIHPGCQPPNENRLFKNNKYYFSVKYSSNETCESAIKVHPFKRYIIEFEIEGKAKVELLIRQKIFEGNKLVYKDRNWKLWESLLKGKREKIRMQFLTIGKKGLNRHQMVEINFNFRYSAVKGNKSIRISPIYLNRISYQR